MAATEDIEAFCPRRKSVALKITLLGKQEVVKDMKRENLMSTMVRIIGLTCVIGVLIMCAGCSIEENWIAGRKWRCEGIKLEFRRDGTVMVEDNENDFTGEFDWCVEDGFLVIDGIEYEYDRMEDTFLNIYIEGRRVTFR